MNLIPSDETTARSPQRQAQAQSQMMFCYKCNNVIPTDSKFCPHCGTELYVICPKCEVKYSSQYPICNQCGTNREEFLQEKWFEEKIKREAIAEKTYKAENSEILKTEEYKSAYALFVDAFKALNKRNNTTAYFTLLFFLPILYYIGMSIWSNGEIQYIRLGMLSFGIWFFLTFAHFFSLFFLHKKFLLKYISKRDNYDKDIITPEFIKIVANKRVVSDYFPDYYIISYRKKNRMPINKSWHSYSY